MDFSKINLDDNQVLAREIIEVANNQNFKDRHDFEKFRNSLIKKHKGRIFHNLYFIRAYNDLLKEGKISENQNLLSLIRKRSIRTLSGVAPVTVMTKPFPCPGRCVYCPADVRMPKSYLPSQPAAQRAFRQRFNPYTQVFVRLKALHMTGHKISKVELRVIGGTWSAYPKRYQKWFIKQSLRALNEFSEQVRSKKISQMKDLIKENIVKSPYGEDKVTTVVLKPLNGSSKFEEIVKINETADVRCIGINIETRPDFIDEKEIHLLRSLGVTKVEMGVQTVDDKVQKITNRGHDLACVKRATKLLKDAGMKIGYHMMPNLSGSTVELDKRMIGELFADEGYQPDYLKIYPCVVVAKSRLMLDYKKGLYKPYDESVLKEVLLEELKSVPEWCRIDRIARDIPSTELIAGFKSSNIRQILEKELIEKGIPCRDIRSREVKNEEVSNVELVVRKYPASGGEELFLSYEDVMKDKLVALLRLRFPCKTFLSELKNAALIREIHVYGKQIAVGEKDGGEKQHVGWGTKLMGKAENLAKAAGYKKIAVIAGIGTREYYRKKGYKLIGTYMLKSL
jgi:elongator complex protein 3